MGSHREFWSEGWFSGGDQINEEIWLWSPAIQRGNQPPDQLFSAGSIGAQQAMLPGDPDGILPWVPDVFGSEWASPDALIIIGSFRPPLTEFDVQRGKDRFGDRA